MENTLEEPQSNSLSRQGSLYSLTLDEVRNHLGNSGKPLGSMNLDELLKSVCSVEVNQSLTMAAADSIAAPLPLPRQGSLTLPHDVSKKTVDEVWREIQQNKNGSSDLGEMTLEDFLLKAGVVTETISGPNNGGETDLGHIVPQHGPLVQYHQLPSMPQPQTFMPYPVSEIQTVVSPSSLMGALSDTHTPGRKRVAEKTVERRQKRMIKNRESAARSRSRKQAYTQELEIKVAQLEEENERLRRKKEVEEVMLPAAAPPPDPKRQLRRTNSAPL